MVTNDMYNDLITFFLDYIAIIFYRNHVDYDV